GRYFPRITREQVFDPPDDLRRNPLTAGEYYRRLNEARLRRRAISFAAEVPLEGPGGVDQVIRAERGHGEFFWRRWPLDDILTGKATSLDFKRFITTPVGGEWSPSYQYDRYVDGFAKRVENARRFGPKMELAKDLVEMAEAEGQDRRLIVDLFDRATEQS